MIIWNGRGFLIAVIGFGSLVVMELFTRAWFHDDTYYQKHGWPMLLGFLAAASVIWLLAPSRKDELDAQSNQDSPVKETLLREQDRLFFISARHWPLILAALGVVCYIVSFYAQD